MSYIALTFDAAAADADQWSDALLDAGALSVDLSDPGAGTGAETPLYGEPGLPPEAAWPVSRICALLDADRDPDALLRAAGSTAGLAPPAHETWPVAEEDWVRRTQAQFSAVKIAPGFWVVPTWAEVPEPQALVLRLDPGLAFGTGTHPTTRLCLQWLQARGMAGATVLDYGCGSGILAIAAARLGAIRVIGTDVDPQAIQASIRNARANLVNAEFVLPDALASGTNGIVVANILANPLILLAPALAARVASGGSIALSGILETQADAVAAAYAPWFTLATWQTQEGWVLLAGEKRR